MKTDFLLPAVGEGLGMRDWPVMSATDAVALLDILAVAGVGFWVNGG